jgi:hypothetical protein
MQELIRQVSEVSGIDGGTLQVAAGAIGVVALGAARWVGGKTLDAFGRWRAARGKMSPLAETVLRKVAGANTKLESFGYLNAGSIRVRPDWFADGNGDLSPTVLVDNTGVTDHLSRRELRAIYAAARAKIVELEVKADAAAKRRLTELASK